MLYPWLETDPGGLLRLRFLPPLTTMALLGLPDVLADDAPGIREHLGRSPFEGDPEAAAQWERYAAPDLAHLFRSARELVLEDLRSLAPEPGLASCFLLEVPPTHLDAWLSALATARVALAEAHSIGDPGEDGSPLPEAIDGARERARLLIHLLGTVQGLLLEEAP